MEVNEFKDRHLLLKLLGRLWQEDRDAFYAFKECLIIIPVWEAEKAGLVVLPGSAEDYIVEEAQRLGLLESEERKATNEKTNP
jgi:hypothetical protein